MKFDTIINILLNLKSIWHVFTKSLVESLLLLIEVLAGADRMMLAPALMPPYKTHLNFLSNLITQIELSKGISQSQNILMHRMVYGVFYFNF